MAPEKEGLIEEAEVKVSDIEREYQQGLYHKRRKEKRLSNDVWLAVTETIARYFMGTVVYTRKRY